MTFLDEVLDAHRRQVADYIAEHPGRRCGQCGTSWEKYTEKVLTRAGTCCRRCHMTDTHGTQAAEEELRRQRRAYADRMAERGGLIGALTRTPIGDPPRTLTGTEANDIADLVFGPASDRTGSPFAETKPE